MSKRIDGETFDAIVTKKLIFGETIETIASSFEISTSTVSALLAIFKAVQEDNTARVIDMVQKNYSGAMIRWAYVRLGKSIPEEVLKAQAEQSDKLRKANLEAAAKKEAEKQEPAPAKPSDNDAIYFCKLLEAVNKQNELLAQLLDVVIPHWVGDLKTNANANADILLKELQAIQRDTECIKLNTRKRGL